MTKSDKNWLEWCVFCLSGILVMGVLGGLVYDGWTTQPTPPKLEVQLGPAQPRAGHYAIPVTVWNRGRRTAEAVQIEVTLTKQDGDKERGQFEIQFVPRQASRHGWVAFETDPRTAKQITARPLGYQSP